MYKIITPFAVQSHCIKHHQFPYITSLHKNQQNIQPLIRIRSNEILKKLYARFRAQGMNHYAAMGVVMHKLLRIIYGVLKSKKTFDAAIDPKNIDKATAQQEAVKKEKEATATEAQTKRNRY